MTDKMAALVQDAQEFGKQPNVPVGAVAAETNSGDDISIISFQSGRSMKDKIKIVQPNEEPPKNEGLLKFKGLVKEQMDLQNIQSAVNDKLKALQVSSKKQWEDIQVSSKKQWEDIQVSSKKQWEDIQVSSKKQWEGLQQNTYNTFETVSTKSKEVVQEKIKPGIQNLGEGSKKFVQVAKDLPKHSKTAVVNIQKSTMEQYHGHVSPRLVKFREFHDTYSQYYMGNAPAVFENVDVSEWKYHLAQVSLLSIGMILNCENPITGAIIWSAMFFASPLVAISGLASLVAAITFHRLVLSSSTDLAWKIRAGANAFLVGAIMSALVDFPTNMFVQLLGKVTLAMALGPTCIFVHLQLFSSILTIPPLLWSYNLVMGVVILDFALWDRASLTSLQLSSGAEDQGYSIFGSTLSSISAIFGILNPWCGLFVLLGVCLCSRILAGWLVTTTCLTSLLGLTFGMEAVDINTGMAGYQAGLTALSCAYYFVPSYKSAIVTALAVVWTCVLESATAAIFYNLIGQPGKFEW
jgi:urea transporter